MDIEELRQLAGVMKDADLGRLEVADGTRRIVLEAKRQALVSYGTRVANMPVAAPAPAPEPAGAEVSARRGAASDLCAQTSPLVGTVYLAAQAGSPPYVKLGDRVNKGDTLCLLESMKMFSEFLADRSGTVAEICVKNGQVVDFGQTLFMLRPEGSADGA